MHPLEFDTTPPQPSTRCSAVWVYFALYFACMLAVFALACAVCAAGYGSDSAYVSGASKVTLAGIVLQAVMGGVSLAYKCKTPAPRDLLLINIIRALFGLSTGLMIAGGLYASAAHLEHGGSNNVKVPWTFSGFSLALIMCAFASRDVVSMWFAVLGNKRAFRHLEGLAQRRLWLDFTSDDLIHYHALGERATEAAQRLVDYLRFKYQLKC